MKKLFILFLAIASCSIGCFSQTVYGDVDGDGYVTVSDATTIYNLILGNTPAMTQYEVNGVVFNMVQVNGGTFMMGENSDLQVTLNTFSIGQTEVTQELWVAVMGSNPSYFCGYGNADCGSYHYWVSYNTNLKRPVEFVSWDLCLEFISKLNQMTGQNFRLPTEAEWEYAALGGSRSEGFIYAGSNNIFDVAWHYGNSLPDSSPDYGTHPVATKAPNELGLYDMSGNVFEWCAPYNSEVQIDPTLPAASDYRKIRGGGWGSAEGWCRIKSAGTNDNTARNSTGLRIVL